MLKRCCAGFVGDHSFCRNRGVFSGRSQSAGRMIPKAAKAGEYEFRINCALCHGLGAHGGGRGPDLTRAQKKHTHSDADMFQVISNGIPGTAMPANGTNGQGVGMTDEEIWQIITYIRSQEVKAPAKHWATRRTARICFTAMRIARCATWSRARADDWVRT